KKAVDHDGDSLDRSLGAETTRIVEIGALDIDSTNAVHAVRYQPSAVELARRSLADCRIDYSQYTFVDYGCGKGRVLLLAAQHPFQEVIGVEFAPELHKIAEANLEAARARVTATIPARAVLCDA